MLLFIFRQSLLGRFNCLARIKKIKTDSLLHYKSPGLLMEVGFLKQIGTTVVSFNPDSQRFFDIQHNVNDVFENVSERELKLGATSMAARIYLVSEYGLYYFF